MGKDIVKCSNFDKVVRLLLALIAGVFVAVFSSGVASVHAAESQEVVTIDDEDVPAAESQDEDADNAGGAVFLLMGGFLLIILTVVITVVSTFVVTAPIADEI